MSESRHERIRRMVENAHHESVTADRLTNDLVTPKGTDVINKASSSFKSKTLESYLTEEEQPHFIFVTKSEDPNIYGPEKKTSPSSSKINKIVHLVTDQRWLMIGGHGGRHQRLEIPLQEIEASNYDTESRLSPQILSNITNSRIILKTEGAYYEIPVSNQYDKNDFSELSGYLREVAGARPRSVSLDPDEAGFTLGGEDHHDVDPATVTTLLDEVPESATDEADDLIQSVDDADTLVQKLTELIEEYEDDEPEKSLDDRVQEADNIDELRDELRTPVEKQFEEIKSATDSGVEDAKSVLQDADPQESARWALNAGRVAKPLTRYGPYGIAAGLVTVLGAGAVGAYADTHEDTILDGIDIEELARHAEAMAGVGEDLEHIDGEVVGTLLGASTYLGRELAPEEYAHWVLEADAEAILLGAERGAEFAQSHGAAHGQKTGGIYGAGIGLLAGYAVEPSTDSDEALSRVLDEDLYEAYNGYREKHL